jgi:NAD dependent epimerase/dehydratase family enzyme
MRLPFSLGLGARLGSGDQWMPWVHVDDVVGLALAAIRDRGYRGPVNAVSPNPVTNRDFTAALASALGRPAFLRAPAFALRLLGEDVAFELLASRRVVPRAAQARGFAFAHPELPGALAAEL